MPEEPSPYNLVMLFIFTWLFKVILCPFCTIGVILLPNYYMRYQCVVVLGKLGSRLSVPGVVYALYDRNSFVFTQTLYILLQMYTQWPNTRKLIRLLSLKPLQRLAKKDSAVQASWVAQSLINAFYGTAKGN